MSDFACPVVRIEKIEKHPNADTLSLTEVEGCPVIVRTTDFKEGDLAVYIPIESLIPEGREWVKEFCSHLTFKNGVHRVKAVRLRKIFSMGMLVPASAGRMEHLRPDLVDHFGFELGFDLSPLLGITKYEEPEDFVPEKSPQAPKTLFGRIGAFFRRLLHLKRKPQPRLFPVYEVGHYRKSQNALKDGEEVVVTEKCHGQCATFAYSSKKKKLIVSSHRVIRGTEDNSNWWRVARDLQLDMKLRFYPDLAFFGEVFGHGVQDLSYGVPPGKLEAMFFDIYDTKAREWLSYDDAINVLKATELNPVPLLYRGPLDREAVMALKDGNTTIGGVKQIREGVVIRRAAGQRCVLKLIGDEYLLRKGGTEKH